jgi:hypothetical protein
MSGYETLPQHENTLALITNNLVREASTNTTVQHGQLAPGDSAISPSKSAEGAKAKVAKKQKPSSQKETVQDSINNSFKAVPVKKKRKPRKSHKKIPTPEQQAKKREQFLKRNREAAHKCRIKKKNQTEDIQENAKELGHVNAQKALEIEKLKLEIETLRALLLPHYRGCGDKHLIDYMDSATSWYELWARETGEKESVEAAGNAQTTRSGSDDSMDEPSSDNTNVSSPADVDDDDEDVTPLQIHSRHSSPQANVPKDGSTRRSAH